MAVLAGAAVLASATEVFFPLVAPSAGNLGLASIYMLAVAVGASISEVRFHFLEIPAVTERTPAAVRTALRPGLAYLFLGQERGPAFAAFRDAIAAVRDGCEPS